MANFYSLCIIKMRKIKILYTIPNFDTAGSGKALLNLALGLDKNKFEPHILCLHDKGAFFKTVKNSGLPVHVFDYLPKERPILSMLTKCWKVSRRFKEINPDIIHSFNYSSNYTEAISARLAGIKWIFTKKNMSWGGSSSNSWKLRSLLAKKIIVQNTDMIKDFYPNSQKTTLIPRGVNISKFEISEPKVEIKKAMGTQIHERVIITVANLVPVKGIEILIEAFSKISNNHSDWNLWIIGDDSSEYGDFLKQKAKDFGVFEKVRFSGKQLDVVSYLNHAEIFVLPTLDKGEGSPVALLEAMANSKLVIGSNVPGIKDQLENFQEHVFQSKNTDDLAEKLSSFFNYKKEEIERIGAIFKEFVSKNYSIESEVKRHEKVYIEIFNE